MLNNELVDLVIALLDNLHVRSRKMFGGVGLFSEKIMFALIYEGILYFRSTEEIAHNYSENSFQFQHPSRSSKMPYWSVHTQLIENKSKFVSWAFNAFKLAKSLKQNI